MIVITGATGFIGSHLCHYLYDEGYTVRAIGHYNSSGYMGLANVYNEYLAGDIRDERFIEDAFDSVDLVIHLAALVDVPMSYEAPRSYIDTNIGGTYNVLEVCRKNRIPLIVTSSSEIYGTTQKESIQEEHRLNPQSIYATTKLAAEQLAWCYHLRYNLPVIILRPFNNYGPGQSERGVVASIIKQLLIGPEVRVGNLESRRDWVFVEDTCRAFHAATKHLPKTSGLFNIATGKDYSVREIINICANILGIENLKIKPVKERKRDASWEVSRLCGDYSLIQKQLGWKPQIDIIDGLERTIEGAWPCKL